MITYNHRNYIAQAIESVLSQRAPFDYQLVIGDDRSTDGTWDVVADYAARHPQVIRARQRATNLGMVPNFVATLRECDGDFVAILEGDDYWTSPIKLEEQVALLESNPLAAATFHDVIIVDESGAHAPKRHPDLGERKDWRVPDLLKTNPVPFGSFLFRQGIVDELPDWFEGLVAADWTLLLLNAHRGPILYVPVCAGVYRVHSQSTWYRSPLEWRLEGEIRALTLLDRHLEFKYSREVAARIGEHYLRLADRCADIGEGARARDYVLQLIRRNAIIHGIAWTRVLKTAVKVLAPRSYERLAYRVRGPRDSIRKRWYGDDN